MHKWSASRTSNACAPAVRPPSAVHKSMPTAPPPRLFTMCRYTTADIIYSQCRLPAQHKIVKRLHRRCEASPKPGPRCANSTYDPALGTHIPSNRNAPCRYCRDSGTSVGQERFEDGSCIICFLSSDCANSMTLMVKQPAWKDIQRVIMGCIPCHAWFCRCLLASISLSAQQILNIEEHRFHILVAGIHFPSS